jgi:hypothetical protein
MKESRIGLDNASSDGTTRVAISDSQSAARHLGAPAARKTPRQVGPVPPRRADGAYDVEPEYQEEQQLNEKNQLVTVKKLLPGWGKIYFPNMKIRDGATKGLKLFAVSVEDLPDTQVYARDEDHAIKVFKQEWGITRLNADAEPRVTEVA